MTTTEREPWGPALVSGRERRGIAFFIEDQRGDLIDIEYECTDCGSVVDTGAQWWPVFDFGDSGAYCRECGTRID